MPQVSTDKKKIEQLLERGVERVYPSAQFLKKRLLSKERLTVYVGIDPTGPDLHIGHSIPLRKLAQFQELGHAVVLLVGDFTALCGDPDKTEARKRLTRKEILKHCETYKEQASKILSFSGANAARYRFNSAWLSTLTLEEIIELGSKITIPRLLERDLFQRRLASGKELYLHEVLYPLMQGYDSVAMAVDGEVGASDQTFNMLVGRDLMKSYHQREKFVLTLRLLEDQTGKKMGKTEGNMVRLHERPEEMFGKIMSWTDEMIALGLELLTDMPMAEIQKRSHDMKAGTLNPRDVKAELARLVVAQYHSVVSAKKAEVRFVSQFKKKETPDDMPTIRAPKGSIMIPDLLVKHKLASSKSEARRLVKQGGVHVNSSVVRDWKKELVLKKGDVIKVGKRRFLKID